MTIISFSSIQSLLGALGGVLSIINTGWILTDKLKSNKKEKRKGEIRDRVYNYVVEAQQDAKGSISITFKDHIREMFPKEESLAQEALNELVLNGMLDVDDGRYYLKGHKPPIM
ncbi:MAG: hypothetical protein HYR79_08945 [Nitrospirae bacterium]|nr:hypothetical protein [Nitrospirota bacterium]